MTAPRPYTLIAELTYRCPLRCPYCSNPVALDHASNELDTADWERVFTEAEVLGIMQVHLTGGEPLARKDLETLVARAHALDLYTNLITSGVPLTEERLDALVAAGLENVQLSFQDHRPDVADAIAGYPAHAHKLKVAAWVKARKVPLTINVVLHAANIDEVASIVALAETLQADRLELANTQYLGWALPNRAALLPTRKQIDRAREQARLATQRIGSRMELVFVLPDYFSGRPKACMDGWGRRYVTVSPDGLVLPCHAAHTLPGLRFDNVKERSLGETWESGEALNRYRGQGWMPEPCKSCEHRHTDFGGCRCQAYHLAGDVDATDPVCELAPAHALVTKAREERAAVPLRYLHRGPPARA